MPKFNVRLAPETHVLLAEMAEDYGTTKSAFVREFLETILSSDAVKIQAFIERLIASAGGQTAFSLSVMASVGPTVASKRAKKGKKRRRHGKAT